MEGRVTLDKADNNVNADKAKLNITFSCDLCSNECQTLEELEAQKNSPVVRNRGGEQLFTVQEAIKMSGRPHGLHQVVSQDLH